VFAEIQTHMRIWWHDTDRTVAQTCTWAIILTKSQYDGWYTC